MSIFNTKEDEEALDKLLEAGKQKLIEAGRELLDAAGDEIDGLTITATWTISRKPKS